MASPGRCHSTRWPSRHPPPWMVSAKTSISTGSPAFRQGCQPRLAESGLMLVRHDVVAVGARTARTATAMLLARFGHDAVLLDRAHLPSDPSPRTRSHAPKWPRTSAGTCSIPCWRPARRHRSRRRPRRARYAPWPGEDRGRRQAGGSTRFPAWPIIHSRHRKMQIPCLARHGPVVTFDGRGDGRSDLRRPGYQRGHRGTPRQARLTGRRT
jgi:hypothetical protein